MLQDLGLLSAPVVDTQGRLIGRIMVDDVVDLIRDESDRIMMQMAGLDDEADRFAPVLMPIVASMGGIAGSQTLTLVIRRLALGRVQKGNIRVLLNRDTCPTGAAVMAAITLHADGEGVKRECRAANMRA